MKHNLGNKSVSGMTMVEVLVAAVLVSFLAVCVYSVIINGLSLSYGVAQRVAAFGRCKEKLEQMRGAGYDNVTTADCATCSILLTHLGGSRRLPLMADRSCTIADVASPTRKVVTVTVEWTFMGRGFEESVSGAIYDK